MEHMAARITAYLDELKLYGKRERQYKKARARGATIISAGDKLTHVEAVAIL